VSDTSDLARGATTSHSRRTSPHLYQEQRKHRSYQALLSHQEAPEMRWVVAEKQVLQVRQALQVLPSPVLELPFLSVAPVIDCSQST
jgi:hypothetical protein